jgi:uncharacterized protein (DUF2235 family)
MGTRIILFSDGTGNAASKVWRTNVWRTFESVDLTSSEQVAIYDDGVGTSSFKPLAILGGAFGWGLKRNVLDLYKFVCRNYQSNQDEIFAFGFSRGAFTIRIVIALIFNQGLVPYQTEAELDKSAKAAYRAFRSENFHSIWRVEQLFRSLRDLVVPGKYDKTKNKPVASVRFLGLWDTVAAYGLPIEEMTRGVSQWIWPLELPERILHKNVMRACHALALDDERTTFHPVLWNERNEIPAPPGAQGVRHTRDERISQVWFAGMHSGVGGGYPDDSLAHIPLCWIMKEAQDCGLKYKISPPADYPDALAEALSARDKDGRMYDSRQGLGGYYRYGPRKIWDLCHMRFSRNPGDEVFIPLPKIHESALKRMRQEAHPYAPIGIPASYEVVTEDRTILSPQQNPFETPQQAAARAKAQEQVWNIVWFRRLVYFATVAASLHLVIYPLVRAIPKSGEYATWLRPLSDSIRIIGSFMPNALAVWINAYARDPGRFLLAALAVAFLTWLSSVALAGKITDEMRTIWRANLATNPTSLWYRLILGLRTSRPYKAFHSAIKQQVAPAIFALFFLYAGVTLASHVIFDFEDSAGLVCRDSPAPRNLAVGETAADLPFATKDICRASGVLLEEGGTYRITVKEIPPWRDGGIETSIAGFYSADQEWKQRALLYLAWPLRRTFIRPWFRVFLRVGSTGNYEDFLDPNGGRDPGVLQERFRPGRSGELFFYVNDAVLALPWLQDVFYRNNSGEAMVTVTRL